MTLRSETPEDHAQVATLIEAAFRNDPHSDHTEHELVARLRQSAAFIPSLSIVAEEQGEIRGHILFTRIHIAEGENRHPSLTLAPVAVHPDHQGKGIGGQLIREGHRVARELGEGSSVLLGHAHYYPRFGYRKCGEYGIKLPFQVPDELCMAIELRAGALRNVRGMVQYAPEFFPDQSEGEK